MGAPIQLKTAEQIRDDFLLAVASGSGITDRELGSEIRDIGYSFGSELDEFYFQLWQATRNTYIKTATGTGLDNRGADFNVFRRDPTNAVGTARFSGINGTVVTAGTLISSEATSARDKIQFVTPSTGVYTVAAGIIDVPISAVVAGSTGNLSSSTITQIDTPIAGISSVTNITATVQGIDREGDDSYRTRILAFIDGLSLGTVAAIRSGAINFEIQTMTLAEDVTAIQTYIDVQEDLTLIPLSIVGTNYISLMLSGSISEVVSYTGINTSSYPHRITGVTRAQKTTLATTHSEGAAVEEYLPTGVVRAVRSASVVESPGNVNVYLDDGSVGGISAELVNVVNLRLVGDGTQRDQGYKAGGITLSSYAVATISVDVTASITAKPGYNLTAVIAGAKTDIEAFINGYDVGYHVYAYEIIERLMVYEGVQTINSISLNGTLFIGSSTADVTITPTQVAMAGAVGIS